MSQFNSIYRAFCDYLKVSQNDKETNKLRQEIKKVNKEEDILVAKRLICHIEDDWIIAIEKGLEFVGNAIKEERQFIRTNGEIIPIEKVKKVSKASVEHLAKHSNLISRIPENERRGIIPDKLYIVEKLSDYAVYENRFLYMLLCHLQEFVSQRINKINEIINTYNGMVKMNKKIELKKRKINFVINFNEERKDNPYPIMDDDTKRTYNRIVDLASIIQSMLTCPLMVEVSKTPMIKPPVVKTNVLKMNNNFKNALALYDYISNYNKPGYSSEDVTKKFNPFTDEIADDFSEFVQLSSFLTFQYGNDLKDMFKKEWEAEEAKLEEQRQHELSEKLKVLKRKISDSNLSLYEYMQMLENRNQYLEKQEELLKEANKKIEELEALIENKNQEIYDLKVEIKYLNGVIEEKNKEIARLIEEYEAKIKALILEYETKIKALIEDYELKIKNLIADYETKLATQKAQYEQIIADLKEEHLKEIEKINNEFMLEKNSIISSYEQKLIEIKEETKKLYEEEIDNLKERLENIDSEYEEKISDIQNEHENEKQEIIDNYDSRIDELNEQIVSINEAKADLEKTKDEEIDNLHEKINICNNEKQDIINECNLKISQALEDKRLYLKECDDKLANSIKEINDECENEKKLLNEQIENISKEASDKYQELLDKYNEAENLRILTLAELHGIRMEHGLMTDLDDFSSKERFIELEREKEAFDKLFNGQWKKAKKAIRKNILWAPTPKIEKKKKAKESENNIENPNKLEDINEDDSLKSSLSSIVEEENVEKKLEDDKDLNSIQSENNDVE